MDYCALIWVERHCDILVFLIIVHVAWVVHLATGIARCLVIRSLPSAPCQLEHLMMKTSNDVCSDKLCESCEVMKARNLA